MPGTKTAEAFKIEGQTPLVSVDSEAVREELRQILESRHFRHTRQGSRFLQYIVEETLKGNSGLLKERLLGVALFGRVPDYPTGDDPIVRVQANDVRRRLEAYAAEHHGQSSILIELPAGSYVPHIGTVELSESVAPAPAFSRTPERHANGNGLAIHGDHSKAPVADPVHREEPPAHHHAPAASRVIAWITLVVICAIAATVYLWRSRQDAADAPDRLAQAFWQPLLASPNPVVISIGKTIVYRPSPAFFRRYTLSHPGTFNTGIERSTRPLPVKPSESLRWDDFDESANQGFSMGSVRSSMALAGFLAQHHKAYSARLGVESSFAEFRNAPAVMIGAFNNRWTLDMTSGLHFGFAEQEGEEPSIREDGPSGRSWTWQTRAGQEPSRDYGLVTRLLVWKTGQAAMSVAGLGHEGTTAATEMVTNPTELAEVLKSLPAGWEHKNLQLVISTDSADGEAGRPTLVAYYLW